MRKIEYDMQTDENKIKLSTIFLGLFFISIPLGTVQIFNSISIVRIFVFFSIFASLFYKKRHAIFRIDKVYIYLYIYIFLSIIQLFFIQYVDVHIRTIFQFLMYFVFVLFINRLEYNTREISFLKRCFSISSWLTILLLIIFSYNFQGRLTFQIFNNEFEDPNELCGYLIPGIIYYMDKLMKYRSNSFFKNIAYTFSVIVFIYFSLLTGSRGGLLTVITGVIITIIFGKTDSINRKKTIISIFKTLIIFSLLLFIFTIIMSILPLELISRFSISSVLESGGTGRIDLWVYFLTKYKESSILYKILGFGLGSTMMTGPNVAHNIYVQLIYESGALGLITYILLLIVLLKESFKLKDKYYFCIYISYLILSLSLSLLLYKPLWGLIILILLNSSQEKQLSIESISENKRNKEG